MSRWRVWPVRALMILVVAGVAWSVSRTLRSRSTPAVASPSPVASPSDAATRGARFNEFRYRRFGADGRGFEIEALESAGDEQTEYRLKQSRVKFTYMAKGVPGNTYIVSDEAILTPTLMKGVFQGHVVATTEEGFELKTDQLIYRGDRGIARTETPVTFRRKDVSGSSRGIVYNAEEGTVEFPAEAYIRIDDEKVGPTEIHAGRATLAREEGALKFIDGVDVRHGRETLTAKSLNASYSEADLALNRLQAVDDVVADLSGGTTLPGTNTPFVGKGRRLLKSRKLFAQLRPDRTLEQLSAIDDAELDMEPEPGSTTDRTVVKAKALSFVFDEQGRLTELQGQKGSTLVTQPKDGAAYSVGCQRLTLSLNPATGSTSTVDFDKDVVLDRGSQKATSGRAHYDPAKAIMEFSDEPKLVDGDQRAELVAKAIVIGTANENVTARNNVKQTLQAAPSGGPFSGGATTITAAGLEYAGASKVATYKGGVLLKSGTDEIRAREIVLRNPSGAGRAVQAKGQVAATVAARTDGPDAAPGSGKVESRSETLDFDESAHTLVYTGDVTLVFGEMRIRSAKATVLLSAAGDSVSRVDAGEPVELYQASRRATGKGLRYVPAERKVTLVGRPARTKDAEQDIEGQTLTFFVGEDRIIVDGRERGRTETIIRPKETPKP